MHLYDFLETKIGLKSTKFLSIFKIFMIKLYNFHKDLKSYTFYEVSFVYYIGIVSI